MLKKARELVGVCGGAWEFDLLLVCVCTCVRVKVDHHLGCCSGNPHPSLPLLHVCKEDVGV